MKTSLNVKSEYVNDHPPYKWQFGKEFEMSGNDISDINQSLLEKVEEEYPSFQGGRVVAQLYCSKEILAIFPFHEIRRQE